MMLLKLPQYLRSGFERPIEISAPPIKYRSRLHLTRVHQSNDAISSSSDHF